MGLAIPSSDLDLVVILPDLEQSRTDGPFSFPFIDFDDDLCGMISFLFRSSAKSLVDIR